jgi:hypothetical protein
VVKLLVLHGADVNRLDTTGGLSALHRAVMSTDPEPLVEAVSKAENIDYFQEDRKGRDIFALAFESNCLLPRWQAAMKFLHDKLIAHPRFPQLTEQLTAMVFHRMDAGRSLAIMKMCS